jgi:hypothetical protein
MLGRLELFVCLRLGQFRREKASGMLGGESQSLRSKRRKKNGEDRSASNMKRSPKFTREHTRAQPDEQAYTRERTRERMVRECSRRTPKDPEARMTRATSGVRQGWSVVRHTRGGSRDRTLLCTATLCRLTQREQASLAISYVRILPRLPEHQDDIPHARSSLPHDPRYPVMKLFSSCALCAAVVLSASTVLAASSAADDKKSKAPPVKPCTVRSSTSGAFFDLHSLSIQPPKDPKDKKGAEATVESWHAKGYDYGSNFTLNFCDPVVEELKDVEGVDRALWRNVSAYYTVGKKTFSLG